MSVAVLVRKIRKLVPGAARSAAHRAGAPLVVRGAQLLCALACAGVADVALNVALDRPLAVAPARASTIWLCEGPGNVPEYRNDSAGKGCRRLDMPEVVSVPGAPRSAGPARGGNGAGGSSARRDAAPAAGAAAGFPRVDAATQRLRDHDRRAVLEHELDAEQARLAQLRARAIRLAGQQGGQQGNGAGESLQALREDIGRAEANSAALRRELANLRD
ncbi:DUF4124 domain-containing protein [Paracidovorax citrulli]